MSKVIKGIEDQPQWRKDFPVDWSKDEYVARRDFTKFLVLTSFGLAVGQFWINIQNSLRKHRGDAPMKPIAFVKDLAVGETRTFEYPNVYDNCLLIRTAEDRFVAYSQKCTHLSCPVRPNVEKSSLHCPCHEGSFDLETGRPTGGPPRRPLDRIDLEIINGQIYAKGVTRRVS